MNHEVDQNKIILQASEWLMRLQEGKLSFEEKKQLELWRQQSPLHEKIWSKALQLQDKFSEIPSDIVVPVMDKIHYYDHQNYKKYLWLLAVIPALSMIYYINHQQQWMADYRSAVGERKTIQLPDGGIIILNSRSAIDVEYSDQQRLIVLRKGEIWVETQEDTLKRPFVVKTQQGTAQALGTKYLVKMDYKHSFIAVSEGAVKITAVQSQQQKVLNIDEKTYFDTQSIHKVNSFAEADIAWVKGFLMINDLPLKDFVKRLEAYQKGTIRLDRELENIKISGTYPIDDMEKVYKMLEQTYGFQINSYAQGYVTNINHKNK